ncbi:MAG TPA: CHAD domain-containing protein [Caulobacteraceae bacterium]|nr:CHAD domain-containing protein [Caulobacteraceae bacterium]
METELKFEVDDAAAERLSQRLGLKGARARTALLRSVYYDTPDTRLNVEGIALRVREDGERRIQTIKRAAKGMGVERGEWETEIGTPSIDLDAAAGTPLEAALDGCAPETLRPAFETVVERRARRVKVEGALVEAALDRGTVKADGADEPILELELELKRGKSEALFALARELAAVAPMNLSFATKAARGYALLEGEPLAPVKAADPALGRADTAEAAFKAIAGSALAQIAANARVLRHVRRIEGLHQLRVGARRLRSAISLFKPMLKDGEVERVKAELKWLTKELDDARNLDVFITETFRPAAKRHSRSMGLSNLGRALITAQTRAYDRAEAALGSERFRSLMIDTAAWIETGPWTSGEDPFLAGLRERSARQAAGEILAQRRRKIRKRGKRLAKLDPEPRHQLRIDVKKLRYACGFFAGLYHGKAGKRLARFVAAMEALQDGLGAVTDIAAADQLTAELATHAGGDDPAKLAFAAGQIAGERQNDEARAMKAAERAFRRFDEAKRFW